MTPQPGQRPGLPVACTIRTSSGTEQWGPLRLSFRNSPCNGCSESLAGQRFTPPGRTDYILHVWFAVTWRRIPQGDSNDHGSTQFQVLSLNLSRLQSSAFLSLDRQAVQIGQAVQIRGQAAWLGVTLAVPRPSSVTSGKSVNLSESPK